MVWFFEREGVRLQCEIRPAQDKGYELVWTTPDGQTHIERSEDPADLTRRRRRLEECLKQDGWKRVGRVTPDKQFL